MTYDAARGFRSRLRRTIAGPMWHGDAVGELLAGVSVTEAHAHPIAGAHSIWELVLHMTTWADIARDRVVAGTPGDPPENVDWPAPPDAPSAAAWRAAVEALSAAHERLADTAMELTPEALDRKVPGRVYTVRTMLDGVAEHGTYHGGQIAILKRALRRP